MFGPASSWSTASRVDRRGTAVSWRRTSPIPSPDRGPRQSDPNASGADWQWQRRMRPALAPGFRSQLKIANANSAPLKSRQFHRETHSPLRHNRNPRRSFGRIRLPVLQGQSGTDWHADQRRRQRRFGHHNELMAFGAATAISAEPCRRGPSGLTLGAKPAVRIERAA